MISFGFFLVKIFDLNSLFVQFQLESHRGPSAVIADVWGGVSGCKFLSSFAFVVVVSKVAKELPMYFMDGPQESKEAASTLKLSLSCETSHSLSCTPSNALT